MKVSPLDNSLNVSISDCEMDDLLWEYDGLHSTYQGECEEIMLEMQRIFYEDLKSKSVIKDLENGFETWEDEVDEHLAKAVFEHMQLNADKVHGEEIWCPICKQGELKEADKLIYCTCCELRLNKDSELKLDFLRQRLAEVHSEHLDRGCRLKPSFFIKAEFNLTALYISCEGCDTFEVVI
ncbi:putative RPA-interacting protein [Lupinus albus]|uniref:Putative RPA-interacting protein n=1 Tax=Lupinus albus TaxID=3870 RepID=A0A6A4PQ26_LUPAL|nr:putative RPA-interacting protein [Lupinus albus]